MTDKEREKLAELEQRLRVIQRRTDSDEIGEIADQISILRLPIEVKK